jgi:hypothetical protein
MKTPKIKVVLADDFYTVLSITVETQADASLLLSWYAVEAPDELEAVIKLLHVRRLR